MEFNAEMTHAGFIAGSFVTGVGETLIVEDPSYATVVATLAGASLDQVGDAIQAARGAFDDGRWSSLPAAERRAACKRFVAALAARADRLTDLVVREAGCPRASSVMQAQVRGPLKQALDA